LSGNAPRPLNINNAAEGSGTTLATQKPMPSPDSAGARKSRSEELKLYSTSCQAPPRSARPSVVTLLIPSGAFPPLPHVAVLAHASIGARAATAPRPRRAAESGSSVIDSRLFTPLELRIRGSGLLVPQHLSQAHEDSLSGLPAAHRKPLTIGQPGSRW
jgi:hypothetical protein